MKIVFTTLTCAFIAITTAFGNYHKKLLCIFSKLFFVRRVTSWLLTPNYYNLFPPQFKTVKKPREFLNRNWVEGSQQQYHILKLSYKSFYVLKKVFFSILLL